MTLDTYEAEILRLSAEGKTTRQLAEWLETTKGIHYSHTTLAIWLKKKKAERAAIAQKTLQEELPKQITKDLEVLNALIDDAEDKAGLVEASWALATQRGDPPEHLAGRISDWIKLKQLILQTVALKLTHAGALQPREGDSGKGPVPVVVLPQGVSFAEWRKYWSQFK